MPKLITYKSIFDKSKVLVERENTKERNLSKAIYAVRPIHGYKVAAFVNDTHIHPDDWHLFELEKNDFIELYPEMGKDSLPWVGAIVGVGLFLTPFIGATAATWGNLLTTSSFWAGMAKAAFIGYSIGSVADSILFPPSVPQLSSDETSDTEYSWAGSRMAIQPDGPMNVIYGQYAVSGTLIMQYITGENPQQETGGDKSNYLHMLIALGEGEIEGIMKEDESETITGAKDYPWIKINNEFLSRYKGVSYDYRLGTQHQSSMRGWHTSSTFYSDNRQVVKGSPITYTTTGVDIDQFEVHLMLPALYNINNQGNPIENKVQFKIQYRKVGAGSWEDGGTHTIRGATKSPIYFNRKIPYEAYIIDNAAYGGTAYSSSNGFGSPEHIFNDDPRYYGWMSASGVPQWIKYDLGSGNEKIVNRYILKNPGFTDAQKYWAIDRIENDPYAPSPGPVDYFKTRPFPRDWVFQGSNNDVDWDTLDTQSDIDEPGYQGEFKSSFSNSTPYRYYRFYITDKNGDYDYVGIGNVKLTSLVDEQDSISSGQYEIKISRITSEFTSFQKSGDLYLTGVTEISFEDIAYRNTALLSLKLEATEQLQGTTPEVRILLRGKKIKVPQLTISSVTQTYDDCYWDDGSSVYKRISDDEPCTDEGSFVTQWSKHPIWCTRDFITNKRYGLGEYIDEDHFDDANARTEAKYCYELADDLDGGTDHRFEIDLCLSRYTSASESLKLLARNFRGWIIPSGKYYKPVIDRERDAVQIFNSSNMNPKSLKTIATKQSQIGNLIQLQYANPDRDYAVETREVPDDDEWTDNKPLRPKTINARGTIRMSQLFRDGRYALNCETYCNKLIEFDADRDTIKCEPGDTIRFQNDLFAWGVGGRVVSATSSSITVNIDVTYTATYEARVRLPNGTLETKTVASVTNNNRTLNISGTFTMTPLTDTVWTYGPSGVDSKPFKVIYISKTWEQQCKLSCLAESSNKYLDTQNVSLPEPTYSSLPNINAPPDNIVDMTLTEMDNVPGFYISFSLPADTNWHHVDFHISLDYKNWSPFRTNITNASNIEVAELVPGIIYYIKAVSYNRVGIANLSPIIDSLTITYNSFQPPNVNGLRLDGESSLGTTEFTTKDPKFVWKKTSLVSGAGNFPAGEEPLGAGQFYDEANYKYLIEIYVAGTRVRKEIIVENYYTYTFEKNVLDNGTAQSAFSIYVWGYNEAANLKSKEPTTLRVSNPAPSAVSSLTATPWMRGVRFSWLKNSEIDIDYYTFRVKVASDSWSEWEKTTDLSYIHSLTGTNIDDHGEDATIYIEVIAVDTFGNESSAQSADASARTLNIQPADIDDFAITASKIFTKIPILSGDIWTNDTPDGDSVTWNSHTLYYNGTAYSITGSNTDKKYIYWINGASTYSSQDTHPKDNVPLGNEDFIIATNIDGEASLAWNAIANQVIGSAFIQTAAIVDAHIANMSGDKILLSSNLAINDSTFGNQGFQAQYNSGTPRMYCGDGADESLEFDGTQAKLSSASQNALVLKSGGGMLVEAGGDIELQGDNTNPAKLKLTGTNDTIEHWIYRGTYEGYYYINPTVDDTMHCYFGSSSYRFNRMDITTGHSAKMQTIYSGVLAGSVGSQATSTYGIGYINAVYDGSNYITVQAYADSSGGILRADIDGAGFVQIFPVSQTALKTSTGSVSQLTSSWERKTLPGGEYGFYPQIKMSHAENRVWGAALLNPDGASLTGWTSYVTNIDLLSNDYAGTRYIYARQRYVTSSGEVHWIFIQRDKLTKNIFSVWQAPDHPCFGNGGKPMLTPHPFPGFDKNTQEIIVINPSKKQILEMKKKTIVPDLEYTFSNIMEDYVSDDSEYYIEYQNEDLEEIFELLNKAEIRDLHERSVINSDVKICYSLPDKDLIEVILEEYDLDETIAPDWPIDPVTVGLPPGWQEKPMGSSIEPIKKVIPKPKMIKTATLKLKNKKLIPIKGD